MAPEESNSAADASSANQRRPAPYGHACAGCSRAKSRCVGRGPDRGCERCRRLGRECQPSTVVRKGRSRRRSPQPNKTAALEQKLDNLVNMLTAQGLARAEDSSSQSEEVSSSQNARLPHVQESVAPPAEPAIPARQWSPSDNLAGVRDVSLWYNSGIPLHPYTPPERSPDGDEVSLKLFRDYHLKSFPFVHIPPETGPLQLQTEKPMLWQVIKMVCCKKVSRRRELDAAFRAELGKRYLVNNERSMDLLLSIIGYLSWLYSYKFGQKVLCAYSSMAASLVFDLRLDRIGRWNPCKETEPFAAYGNPMKKPLPPPERTNEERRAAIACFCLCSTISCFIRTPPMRWTPHLDDILNDLTTKPEVFGDELLATMARSLKIAEDVLSASGWRFFEAEASSPSKAPPSLHVKPLRSALDSLRRSLRPEVAENKVVRSYLAWTSAMINELGLIPQQAYNSSGPGWLAFGRVECFHSCIEAAKALLDNFIAVTPHEMFGMYFGIGLQYAQVAHIVYRLALAPHDDTIDPSQDYDRASVHKAIDLPYTQELCAQLWGSVPEAVGLETDGTDPYTTGATNMRAWGITWAKTFAEQGARRSRPEASNATMATTAGEQSSEAAVGENADNDIHMDYSAGLWMSDMFINWDEF